LSAWTSQSVFVVALFAIITVLASTRYASARYAPESAAFAVWFCEWELHHFFPIPMSIVSIALPQPFVYCSVTMIIDLCRHYEHILMPIAVRMVMMTCMALVTRPWEEAIMGLDGGALPFFTC
jgi:hypothetical protein